MTKPLVLIVGAGPAGLTAALELVRDGRMDVLILEASSEVGGISRTVNYKGNRMDIGGHRFFSKSNWVMNWWREIMPITPMAELSLPAVAISYQGQQRQVPMTDAGGASHVAPGLVMLLRRRLRVFTTCASISTTRSNSAVQLWLTSVRCGWSASE